MRNLLIRYLLFTLTLLFMCILAHSQESYKVRKITFEGNKSLEKSFLLEKIALKEVSTFKRLLTKEQPFLYSSELINADIQRVVAIYQSEGYIDAKATLLPLTINNKKQTVNITVKIEEGEPIIVDSIYFRAKGNFPPSMMDSIAKRVIIKSSLLKNKRFRDQLLLLDIELLENEFKNLGYAYVKVDYNLDLDLENYLTGVEYIINSGDLCYVGETTIEGYDRTSKKVVLKQLSYKKGELYNKSMLEKTRENLYSLKLFKVVSVLPETDPETLKNPIPIAVYLERAPKFSSTFGAGYGTEDHFRAFADLNFNGFLGAARRLNLNLKHSAVKPYSVSLRWIQPQFIGKKSSIIINPFIERNKEPGYDIHSYGINIPINYQITPYINSTLTYYYEKIKHYVEEGDALGLDPENNKFLYNKSGVVFAAFLNNSEPQLSPTKGSYLSLVYKLNGFLFGGKFNYNRLWSEFRQYQEVGNVVFAFRALVGLINSQDSSKYVPVEDRFYSGGSNSVRGWDRSELGPKRESGTPLGGKSILEANIEARIPLFWRVSAVAFVDAGNVWTESLKYRLGELTYAIGAGIRIKTLIGPIRLDIGFPVGNEKKSPQFFLSVGQAF